MTGTCLRCLCAHEPHTPRLAKCTVCWRYSKLVSRSAKARSDGTSPGIDLTLAEFASWFADQERRCRFCGIGEPDIAALQVRTQTGEQLLRLGVDRLDSGDGYRLGNIGLCCFHCNRLKSNVFTDAEMAVLGSAMAAVWRARLANPTGDAETEVCGLGGE